MRRFVRGHMRVYPQNHGMLSRLTACTKSIGTYPKELALHTIPEVV
ncbi:MAG: hypothetical protein AAGE84_18690 [Cyanobacteria bacterium P01_G01_bin.39]